MEYEDEVWGMLEDRLLVSELERWREKITQVIKLEEGSVDDKTLPRVLVQNIVDCIDSGEWDEGVPEEFLSWKRNCGFGFEELLVY